MLDNIADVIILVLNLSHQGCSNIFRHTTKYPPRDLVYNEMVSLESSSTIDFTQRMGQVETFS